MTQAGKEAHRNALAAATWLLRKAARRYQGDPINRASLLEARAIYRKAVTS